MSHTVDPPAKKKETHKKSTPEITHETKNSKYRRDSLGGKNDDGRLPFIFTAK